MTALYRPEIVHSLPTLKQFFQGDEDLALIRALAESPRPEPFGGRWHVTWLAVTAPLKFISALFLWAIAPILRLFGATDVAIHAEVIGGQLLSEVLPLIHYVEEGANYLAPLFNTYAFSASPVYLTPQLRTETLQDAPEIQNCAAGFEFINFYQNGVCRGISHWFAYLYLHTQQAFEDPEAHLCAVAGRFSSGANSQAALLQALYFPEKLLGFRVEPGEEIPYVQNQINAAFEGAAAGAYFVEVPYHRLLLIKTRERGYLINPSEGVVRLEQPAWRYLKKYEAVDYPHNFAILSKISIDS